tara:strand:+ start:739 stop:1416 length:678 start_codon:yes stop_codon:yes gene_type:complete
MFLSVKKIFTTSFIISLMTVSYDLSAQSTLNLRTEIRAPDKWEMIWDIATEDPKVVSIYMEHYRENGYRELKKEYALYCKCSAVWLEMSQSRDLPPSAAYIPLKLNYISKTCTEAEHLFDEMSLFSENVADHMTELRNLFGRSVGFTEFLYDLRVFVRLIENHDVSLLVESTDYDGQIDHMIQYGETLYSISMKYKVAVSEIQRANGMGTSIEIKADHKLRIPNK